MVIDTLNIWHLLWENITNCTGLWRYGEIPGSTL